MARSMQEDESLIWRLVFIFLSDLIFFSYFLTDLIFFTDLLFGSSDYLYPTAQALHATFVFVGDCYFEFNNRY